MIIVKMLAFTMILGICTVVGILFSQRYRERVLYLQGLINALQMLETKIRYISEPIPDAFLDISARLDNPAQNLFRQTAGYLKSEYGLSAQEAWRKALGEEVASARINQEDKDAVLSFGASLGQTDVEGQIKNISLTMCQIRTQVQRAEEERKKNEKLCKSLGIMAGAAICIILI